MSNSGWVGFDLDATVAKYDGFKGPTVIGEPIPAMVDRIKALLAKGVKVKIFTARVWAPLLTDPSYGTKEWSNRQQEARHARRAIEDWTELHIGTRLEVTCMKDYSMWELYDDRARQVIPNTGIVVGDVDVEAQDPINKKNRMIGEAIRRLYEEGHQEALPFQFLIDTVDKAVDSVRT